jgi:hypothetical protein
VGFVVMDQSFFRQSFVELIVVHPCTVSEKALAKHCSFSREAVCPSMTDFIIRLMPVCRSSPLLPL